ncbi:MAG: endonuclease/exonuclease/phosphatase family protein [Terrimicrobiaceae bacterium]|jgi:endonuclease/exonuclease/phosphatase (EEP) superfamily protein YafD
MYRLVLLILLTIGCATASDRAPIRVVAANLTSGKQQAYSPDNSNHSNVEGAGARILKALKPDIVLIQEFNTTTPTRQWVNSTFGPSFHFVQEPGPGIPNGIISRFPIIESGEWDDVTLENRDFVWAKIALPDGTKLWAVSVHLYTKSAQARADQARALVGLLRDRVLPGERLLIGGDLNTRDTSETCFAELAKMVAIPPDPPSDQLGNIHTNSPRNKPYDWVLVDPVTEAAESPVALAGNEFADGFVFDSRAFDAANIPPPVQPNDSGVFGMQHMAVVRDFAIGK